MLKYDELPNWILKYEVEDLNFIKKFILFSGSLKDMAKDYGVTYPTLRIRLNKIIEKLNEVEEPQDDDFISRIKNLAIDDKIDIDAAKILINEYRRIKK
jgi:hypothetical protein